MLNAMPIIRNWVYLMQRLGTVGVAGAVAALTLLILSGCVDEIGERSPRESAEQVEEPEPEQTAQPEPEQASAPAVDEQAQAQSAPVQQAQTAQDAEEARGVRLPPPVVTFLPRDAVETAEGLPIIRDAQTPEYFGLDWRTDWGIRLVDLSEFARGAGRDAIPALSGPLYWTLAEASAVYADNMPLVQVNVNGDVRGFPLEILTWHEIVNDVIGGVPVAVTFCPLCNTAIAFESQIGEVVYKFGVSGLLRNSDLVMYDRNTESLWQQSSGRAIVGVMVGARLKYVPASVVTVGQLRAAYPDALVLSRETGWNRAYGQNPYQGYDNPTEGGPYSFFFDRETIDERLPPAERVVSIEGPSGAAIAYAWSALEQERVVHDTFDGLELVVFWTPGALSILDRGVISDARAVGTTAVFETSLAGRSLRFRVNPEDADGQTFIDEQTGTVWDIFGRAVAGELAGAQLVRVIHADHFWFAWQAFHPDTEVVALPLEAEAESGPESESADGG